MAADIFISYSSSDREKAEQLTELLTSAGLSVWIDKSGIDLATSWSQEIVHAIDACKAFVVLLSASSIASINVTKEVSLAAGKRKKILPLDLEQSGDAPVVLSADLQYHLAGIQRAPISNIDAILRALSKLGLEYSHAPSITLVKETDGRKSLMILPFEDLSPTGDNAWFADGLASELITALSNVKALRVADAQATKEFKKYCGQLTTYAREMNIRYFVQGDVRKFGDNIKITSRLLDIETGDHLWQDSMKGAMEDIFDIQEKVAEKVVDGLKIHLAADEKKKLAERGTENAEAYELCMRADQYFFRQTKECFKHAIQLYSEAIKLDAGYARAYQSKANALVGLYTNYERTSTLLDEAESLCKEALRIADDPSKPDLPGVYNPLSHVYLHRGQLASAEDAAKEYVRRDPQNPLSHASLGFFYGATGQFSKSIASSEEAARLNPENLTNLWNLVVSCDAGGAHEKRLYWAAMAVPFYERRIKLHPDDEGHQIQHAALLQMSGRTQDAHAAAMRLTNLKDANSLYNMACILGRVGDPREALRTFRRAIEMGFRNIPLLKGFTTDANEGVLALQGTPEYDEVQRMVEAIERIAADPGEASANG